jgi:hypothetical protein
MSAAACTTAYAEADTSSKAAACSQSTRGYAVPQQNTQGLQTLETNACT